MFDATYEDLLGVYMKLCQQHEDAVDNLMNCATERRHSDFNRSVKLTRKLASETETAYLALQARRKTVGDRVSR